MNTQTNDEIEIALNSLRHAHTAIKTRAMPKPMLNWHSKQYNLQVDTLLIKIKEAIQYAELVKKHFS